MVFWTFLIKLNTSTTTITQFCMAWVIHESGDRKQGDSYRAVLEAYVLPYFRATNMTYFAWGSTEVQKLNKAFNIQSTLGFATMGKAANLALATRNAVTDLF